MSQVTEETILEFLQIGEKKRAVDGVLSLYGPELRGYLRGTLCSDFDGDDVYQDLSIALWEGLDRFRGDSSLRTWAYRISHYLIQKRLRRVSQRNFVRLNTFEEEGLAQPSHNSAQQHAQRLEALQVASAQLRPDERELLILRAERGMSFSDAAAILKITEVAARKKYQRAKERLRELVAEAAGHPRGAEESS